MLKASKTSITKHNNRFFVDTYFDPLSTVDTVDQSSSLIHFHHWPSRKPHTSLLFLIPYMQLFLLSPLASLFLSKCCCWYISVLGSPVFFINNKLMVDISFSLVALNITCYILKTLKSRLPAWIFSLNLFILNSFFCMTNRHLLFNIFIRSNGIQVFRTIVSSLNVLFTFFLCIQDDYFNLFLHATVVFFSPLFMSLDVSYLFITLALHIFLNCFLQLYSHTFYPILCFIWILSSFMSIFLLCVPTIIRIMLFCDMYLLT